jgi:hypothetical protein
VAFHAITVFQLNPLVMFIATEVTCPTESTSMASMSALESIHVLPVMRNGSSWAAFANPGLQWCCRSVRMTTQQQ